MCVSFYELYWMEGFVRNSNRRTVLQLSHSKAVRVWFDAAQPMGRFAACLSWGDVCWLWNLNLPAAQPSPWGSCCQKSSDAAPVTVTYSTVAYVTSPLWLAEGFSHTTCSTLSFTQPQSPSVLCCGSLRCTVLNHPWWQNKVYIYMT